MSINRFFLSILFLAAGLQGCSSENYLVEIEPSGTKIVKGFFERRQLESDSLFSWYNTNFESYVLDSAAVREIGANSKNIHFVMIVGTWCGDSKREVPQLFKIFDAAKISSDKVLMFGVDRSKKSEDGTTEKYRILRVPTLIVYNGEQELGRIVEQPRETLEKDLLKILNNQ